MTTKVVLEPVGSSAKTLDTVDGPLTEISSPDESEGFLGVVVTDTTGRVRTRARTPWIAPSSFEGATYPLFISRTDRFSRPPGALPSAPGAAPLLASVEGRYLLAQVPADGATMRFAVYDFLAWTSPTDVLSFDCPNSPCGLLGLVASGSYLLALGDGWARWVSVYDGSEAEVSLPDGLESLAPLLQGRQLVASSLHSFLVASAGTEAAQSAVLELYSTGDLLAYQQKTKRRAAATQWVEGTGLVVAGGSDTGSGLEVLAPEATAFVSVPYPPDATEGAGLVPLADGRLLRAGGTTDGTTPAESVIVDPTCTANCVPENHPAGALPLLSVTASLGSEPALFVGVDEDGATKGYLLRDDQWVEAPLREARLGASALVAPTGHLCVAGGKDADGTALTTIELLLP